MTSIIYNNHLGSTSTPNRTNLGKNDDMDIVEQYLGHRRRPEYSEVDKLLDALLHPDSLSQTRSFHSELGNCDISSIHTRRLDDAEKHKIEEISCQKEPNLSENHVENLYLVKVLKNWFNFREGSFSEMIANGVTNFMHLILWIITHKNTRAVLRQVGMKFFELFVTIILAGLMLMVSILTCGKDLEPKRKESESKGKEMVKVLPCEIRTPKPSTSRLNVLNF